jgi:hypothetical protein
MKWSNRRLRSVLIAAVLAVASVAGVNAQTYQGALRGAVRDAQGVIPAPK